MKWSTNGFEVLPNTLSYDHTIMLVSELAEIMEKDDHRTIKNKGDIAVKITSEHDHEIVCLDFYSLPIFNSVAMIQSLLYCCLNESLNLLRCHVI